MNTNNGVKGLFYQGKASVNGDMNAAGQLVMGGAVTIATGNSITGQTKGLVTPKKFFGNLTPEEAITKLETKYGNPVYSTENKTSFFNPTTKRSFTVHVEEGHGSPHVDVNTRGWPAPLNHQKFTLKPVINEPNFSKFTLK